MHPVIDDDVRLNAAAIVIDLFSESFIPGILPITVKPKDANITVICKEFFQFSFHVWQVPGKISII